MVPAAKPYFGVTVTVVPMGGPTPGTARIRRPIFTVMADLLEELGDPSWRDRGMDRPLVQMVDDWHKFPDTREQLLSSVPPADANPLHLLKIAAVLHALCDCGGYDTPLWVRDQRADPPFALFGVPLDSDYARLVYRDSPPACGYHGVWFPKEFVRPKRHGLVNPVADKTPTEFRAMLNIIETPDWAKSR